MNAARAALDALPGGRDILMYGESWQGGGSQLHRYEANKANLAMLNERIGIVCDDTRDAIKGGGFNAREPGYVEGKPGSFWDKMCIRDSTGTSPCRDRRSGRPAGCPV